MCLNKGVKTVFISINLRNKTHRFRAYMVKKRDNVTNIFKSFLFGQISVRFLINMREFRAMRAPATGHAILGRHAFLSITPAASSGIAMKQTYFENVAVSC